MLAKYAGVALKALGIALLIFGLWIAPLWAKALFLGFSTLVTLTAGVCAGYFKEVK